MRRRQIQYKHIKLPPGWSVRKIMNLIIVLLLIWTVFGLMVGMSAVIWNCKIWDDLPYYEEKDPCTSPGHMLLKVSNQRNYTIGNHVYCNTTAVCLDKDSVVKLNLSIPTWNTLNARVKTTFIGGHFRPAGCLPQYRVAIVIPYRNRETQLLTFLQHIHPFLQRQLIEYRLFVIELSEGINFNRGMLMNIGFTEATKYDRFNCFIFHDVDLLPENARNLYVCDEGYARHLSVAVDKYQYKLPYPTIMGGVLALTKNMFLELNGFSNKYFGWGAEDDDMYQRFTNDKVTVTRSPETIARYTMIKHAQQTESPLEMRRRLIKEAKLRHHKEGLNTLKYTVLERTVEPLYTWIYVTIDVRDYNCTVNDNCTPLT